MLRLFSSGHLAIIPIAVTLGFIADSATVVCRITELTQQVRPPLTHTERNRQRETHTETGSWTDLKPDVSGDKSISR